MLRSVTGEDHTIRNVSRRTSSSAPRLCGETVTPLLVTPGLKTSQQKSTLVHTRTLSPVAELTQKQTVAHKASLASARSLAAPVFSYSDFAKQLALKPTATGAIAPSSKLLARKTVSQANLKEARTIVELGPGTGVFTEEILQNICAAQTFFAIELNQTFVSATRNRCPDACVYHDAASSLPYWLAKHNRSHTDCIISSLPWTIFDKSEQDEMMRVIRNSLLPGGVFVSIIYLGAKYRSRGRYFINNLQQHFSSVTHTPTVWQNLPPSQIYRCVK